MWQRLIGWFKLLWDAGEKINEHTTAIGELGESDGQLLHLLQALATRLELLQKDNEMLRQQLQHERQQQRDELKKIELRLRLQLSEELRRLPPGKDE